MKIKHLTIDDLAVILKRQFERIDDRFDSIDEKFGAIDKEFGAINEKISAINKELTETKAGVNRLEFRFDKIEDTVFNDHTIRIRVLEKRVGIN